jgi:hypothetical protein
LLDGWLTIGLIGGAPPKGIMVDKDIVARVSFEQSEWVGVRKPLPGACDPAAYPTVTQISDGYRPVSF